MAEVAKRSGNGSDVERRPYEDLIHDLANMAELGGNDSFEIAANVIDLITTASSAEEVFAANEKGPADPQDYFGQTLLVLDARYRKSAPKYAEGSLGYYVIFDFIDPNGEKGTMSTGANNVVASIRRFQRLNMIDGVSGFPLVIKGRETERGTLYTVHAPS